MHRFKKRGKTISTELEPAEVQLLQSLLGELVELLDAEADPQSDSPPDDPFVAWAAELADQGPVEPPQDPVLQRLLPDAYPDDPKASAEFRRFTERNLRKKKVADADLVRAQLSATMNGSQPLRIPVGDAGAWLRTLTSLRLAVAGRLGITDNERAEELAELPDDDPRAFMVSVYDWLGFAQETLVSAL